MARFTLDPARVAARIWLRIANSVLGLAWLFKCSSSARPCTTERGREAGRATGDAFFEAALSVLTHSNINYSGGLRGSRRVRSIDRHHGGGKAGQHPACICLSSSFDPLHVSLQATSHVLNALDQPIIPVPHPAGPPFLGGCLSRAPASCLAGVPWGAWWAGQCVCRCTHSCTGCGRASAALAGLPG